MARRFTRPTYGKSLSQSPVAADSSSSDSSIDPFILGPTSRKKVTSTPGNSDIKARSSIQGSTLKGLQFPGMDLFDAATDEMKRGRNQPKSCDSLESIRARSILVQPNMVIYDAQGSFQEARNVFDPPSCDSSPVSLLCLAAMPMTDQGLAQVRPASPKKRKARQPTFKNVTNTRRGKRALISPYSVPAPSYALQSINQLVTSIDAGDSRHLNPLAQIGRLLETKRLQEDSMRMNNKKRAFAVYQEPPSPGRTESPPSLDWYVKPS